MASNTLHGSLLGAFLAELGSQILVHFPNVGILNSRTFACIAKVAFDAVFGSLLDLVFGRNFDEFGSLILV